MKKVFRKVNDKVMGKSAGIVGMPLVFYILLVSILGSLLWERPHDVQGWLLWGCTILFQGAALVPIQYTGNKTSKQISDMHTWMRAEKQTDRQTLDAVHELVTELHQSHIGGEHHAYKRREDTRGRETLGTSEGSSRKGRTKR